jgi:hypothetical protein
LDFRFELDHWGSRERRCAESYWASRAFELQGTPVEGYYGRRGDFYGNLFAFDIRKICSEVLVEFADGIVHSRLRIDFRFQIMSEWNLIEYKMEQLLFRNALLGVEPPSFLAEIRPTRLWSQLYWTFFFKRQASPNEYLEDMLVLTEGGTPIFEFVDEERA